MEKSWSQIFEEENSGTPGGLQKQIARENNLKRGVLRSVFQWRRIIEEMEGTYGSSKSENEYRIRYFYQHQYNEVLQGEIDDLKSQMRAAKHDKKSVVDTTSYLSFSMPELRQHIRTLKLEICSLKSLMIMNERKLDQESMTYHKLRNACDLILNDVLFQQKSRLEQQEQYDKEFFARIRRNFHETLSGNHRSRTSCLGLAASRSAYSSTHASRSRQLPHMKDSSAKSVSKMEPTKGNLKSETKKERISTLPTLKQENKKWGKTSQAIPESSPKPISNKRIKQGSHISDDAYRNEKKVNKRVLNQTHKQETARKISELH
ncbi:hypothetical protein SNE40_011841 [Patella caerulea]|uniref:Uncharacterized protein n=1 Tax=Patella caerulea TaxID=87958 RepID=A0AAN8JQ02_PATCE